MSRAEKVAMAQALRGEGLTTREIALRLGVKRSTADGYLNDPDLSAQRRRRANYSRPCEECGGPTDGSGGYAVQRSICQSCRTWTEEAMIDAIQRWAEEHGGIPPTAGEWRLASPGYPCHTTVVNRIGWNEALLRAGFSLKCDRRPETQEWIEAQLLAGVPTQEIADALGVTPNNIHQRCRYHGKRVSEIRAAA